MQGRAQGSALLVSKVQPCSDFSAEIGKVQSSLQWTSRAVNVETCEHNRLFFIRVNLQTEQNGTYAGHANGSPLPLPRMSNTSGKVFFLRHWIRRISNAEVQSAIISEIEHPYLRVAVLPSCLILRVDIDRPFEAGCALNSASFGAWMFQVLQVDAIVDGLPNVRLQIAIERTLALEEKAAVESRNTNSTVQGLHDPLAASARAASAPSSSEQGPRDLVATPNALANQQQQQRATNAKAGVHTAVVPPASAVGNPQVIIDAVPGASGGNTTVPVANPVKYSAKPQTPGGSIILAGQQAVTGANAQPAGGADVVAGSKNIAPRILGSPGARLQAVPKTPVRAPDNQHQMRSTMPRPPAIPALQVSGHRNPTQGLPARYPASKNIPASKASAARSGVVGGAAEHCGTRGTRRADKSTVGAHSQARGRTTTKQQEDHAQPEQNKERAALGPPIHPHIKLWTESANPLGPYEPFFVTEEDPNSQTKLGTRYVVPCATENAVKYHHSKLHVLPGADLPRNYDEWPTIDTVVAEEESGLMVYPSKRARLAAEDDETESGTKPAGDSGDGGEQDTDAVYIFAVKAASEYNSSLVSRREKLSRWYIQDASMTREQLKSHGQEREDESSASE